jgi:hypothetical protein
VREANLIPDIHDCSFNLGGQQVGKITVVLLAVSAKAEEVGILTTSAGGVAIAKALTAAITED